MQGLMTKKEIECYKNQIHSFRSPFNFNLSGKEELHDDVLINFVKLVDNFDWDFAARMYKRKIK